MAPATSPRCHKGIGRATAEQLGALGMTVLIGARDPRRGAQAAAAVRADGGDTLGAGGPTGGFFSDDGPVAW